VKFRRFSIKTQMGFVLIVALDFALFRMLGPGWGPWAAQGDAPRLFDFRCRCSSSVCCVNFQMRPGFTPHAAPLPQGKT
jgi:hypothetical protein